MIVEKMHEYPACTTVDDFIPLVGGDTIDRIKDKAQKCADMHITHVNSTYYGGGVAEMLSSLTLLMNSVGIRTGWRVIQGSPDFFSITKKMHNAMQGGSINLSPMKKKIYEEVIFENVVRNHIDHDIVLIHDPQPLSMIKHYRKRGPWIWRCHIDMSNPNDTLWEYVKPVVERYDAVILSMEEYKQDIATPQLFFKPAINPFIIKNRELSEDEIADRFKKYNIPTDLPLVVQISRFDKWKDPVGVIKAFNKARKHVDATLVLLGNVATDDPEGEEVYKSLLDYRSDRIIILSREDTALVNALQTKASVVLQKSLREGFGLTVAEAMWKRTPVIGGNVGGIKYQIDEGENGFLVSDIDEAADKIVYLLRNPEKRREMGDNARAKVEKHFLLTRLLEQYLDLFLSFKTNFSLDDRFA